MVEYAKVVAVTFVSLHFFAIRVHGIPHVCVNEAKYNHAQFKECLAHMCDLTLKLGAFQRTADTLVREAQRDARASTLAAQYMEEALVKVLHVTQGEKSSNKGSGAATLIQKSLIEAQRALGVVTKEALEIAGKSDKAKRDAEWAERGLQQTLSYTARRACSPGGVFSQSEEIERDQCNVSTHVVHGCTHKSLTINSDILRRTFERLKSVIRVPNKTINEHMPQHRGWRELVGPAVAGLGNMENSASVARTYKGQVMQALADAREAASSVGVTIEEIRDLESISEIEDAAFTPATAIAVFIISALFTNQCR